MRAPIAAHIPVYQTRSSVTEDDPEIVIPLGIGHETMTHWDPRTERSVGCDGPECVHCIANIKQTPVYYCPALVQRTRNLQGGLIEKYWSRVVFGFTKSACEKCGPKAFQRGEAYRVWRKKSGKQWWMIAEYAQHVHEIVEPSFDLFPILGNAWNSTIESRAAVLEVLRGLPPEVTPPVLDKPRFTIVDPHHDYPVPTVRTPEEQELIQAMLDDYKKRNRIPEPVPAEAPTVSMDEFRKMQAKLAQVEAENERLRKLQGQEETAKAETLSPGAQKMEKVIAEHHKNKTLSHEGKTIPIPPDPKPNPEPIGDSLRGMPRNERGAA